MNLRKNEILEALGLQQPEDVSMWLGPAMIGFGIGALVGATVALLVTPRTGMELREDLMDRGRRAVQRGRERVEEVASEVSRSEPRH